LKDLH